MLVQVSDCALGWWCVVVLYDGCGQWSTEVVLFNQALLQCSFSRKEFVKVFVGKVRMETHDFESTSFLLGILSNILRGFSDRTGDSAFGFVISGDSGSWSIVLSFGSGWGSVVSLYSSTASSLSILSHESSIISSSVVLVDASVFVGWAAIKLFDSALIRSLGLS